MNKAVVKVDVAGSKRFAATREIEDPTVRGQLLLRLLEVAAPRFPQSERRYPDGTHYKADGDALYFVLEKPTVALRAAIEFMQDWHSETREAGYPDIRVFIDYGEVQDIPISTGDVELVGRPFERISIVEKGLPAGKLYVTHSFVRAADPTLAKYSFLQEYSSDSGPIRLFAVDFLDPRTTADSSLFHALFVTHPTADAARDRVFEIFAIEYAIETGGLNSLEDFSAWLQRKRYPQPPLSDLARIIDKSNYFQKTPEADCFAALRADAVSEIEKSREEFRADRKKCAETVRLSLIETMGSNACDEVDLGKLIEEYLSLVFSELRLMANYFRSTHHVFASDSATFRRFDFLIQGHVPWLAGEHFQAWRTAFLRGLMLAADRGNVYIASVFHNILAVYYLNRSAAVTAYQEALLRKRTIILDTNVLYALQIPASRYHQLIDYFVGRLAKLGTLPQVFEFSLEEYEASLSLVERAYCKGRPEAWLIRRNPALLREFHANSQRYLNSMAVCRAQYSLVAEGANLADAQASLAKRGLRLAKTTVRLDDDDAKRTWQELEHAMISPQWQMDEFWSFVNGATDRAEAKNQHDARLIANVDEMYRHAPPDDLGPMVLLVTIDRRYVGRLRRRYPFVMTAEQFVEFLLPYLFICDVPVVEPTRFPNLLLSAELATLIVHEPPDLTETVGAYLRDPGAMAARDGDTDEIRAVAKALGSERFKEIMERARSLSADDQQDVAGDIAEEIRAVMRAERERRTGQSQRELEVESLRQDLKDKEWSLAKAQRTIRYWKQQARRELKQG